MIEFLERRKMAKFLTFWNFCFCFFFLKKSLIAKIDNFWYIYIIQGRDGLNVTLEKLVERVLPMMQQHARIGGLPGPPGPVGPRVSWARNGRIEIFTLHSFVRSFYYCEFRFFFLNQKYVQTVGSKGWRRITWRTRTTRFTRSCWHKRWARWNWTTRFNRSTRITRTFSKSLIIFLIFVK